MVISHDQAVTLGLTDRAIYRRAGLGIWNRLLPRVYLALGGEPSRLQRLIAAQLYAGPDSAIDADDACVFHGVKAVRADDKIVRVVVPQTSSSRSFAFVQVRRTSEPIETVNTQRLRYLEPAAAVIAAARLRTSQRAVLAILSDAVQRNIVTPEALLHAHVAGTRRNARLIEGALEHICAGVRSAPEGSFRVLAERSPILPPLLYNRLLRLPNGAVIAPDALALDAALVHETNGRRAHARADLFDDMQVRHSMMTEAGLTVLHSTPARIWSHGRDVIAQFERTYARLPKFGLPAGVRLLPIAA
jgi:hypothetical protein